MNVGHQLVRVKSAFFTDDYAVGRLCGHGALSVGANSRCARDSVGPDHHRFTIDREAMRFECCRETCKSVATQSSGGNCGPTSPMPSQQRTRKLLSRSTPDCCRSSEMRRSSSPAGPLAQLGAGSVISRSAPTKPIIWHFAFDRVDRRDRRPSGRRLHRAAVIVFCCPA